MTKIKFALFLIVTFFVSFIAAEELGNLSPEQLIEMQKHDNALVIDIRTEKEWNTTGVIPDSHKLQFFTPTGKSDADEWMSGFNQLRTNSEQPVILICRSGNRSRIIGNMLTKKMGLKNIYHLSDGIMPWIKAGNKVTKDCPTELACK